VNSISIAAIHATILTILIGFVSAYGIFKRTTIENATIEVLEQAEEINTVNFATAIYFPKNQLEDLKLEEEIARYADDIRVYLGMPKPGSRLSERMSERMGTSMILCFSLVAGCEAMGRGFVVV